MADELGTRERAGASLASANPTAAPNVMPLVEARTPVRCGVPLPWNVRDESGNLLLARGQVLGSPHQVQSLLARAVFVDIEEEQAAAREAAQVKPPVESPFDRWATLQTRLGVVLKAPAQASFLEGVQGCAQVLNNLCERYPDQLIFAVMQHGRGRHGNYAVAHSLHAATVCSLISSRLGWTEQQRASLVGAAMTMNLGMLDLQSRLAARGGTLQPEEKALVQAHPLRSVEMLQAAGLTDELWLRAVLEHHEDPGGTGYPNKVATPCDASQALRLVDIFTAKHSPRAGRAALPAKRAAQELYLQNKDHPVAAVLIKEFGIYPPGCYVRLASGETAIVVRRGASANTPLAAALTNRNGDTLGDPLRRDTSQAAYAIASTVEETAVLVRFSDKKLYAICGCD